MACCGGFSTLYQEAAQNGASDTFAQMVSLLGKPNRALILSDMNAQQIINQIMHLQQPQHQKEMLSRFQKQYKPSEKLMSTLMEVMGEAPTTKPPSTANAATSTVGKLMQEAPVSLVAQFPAIQKMMQSDPEINRIVTQLLANPSQLLRLLLDDALYTTVIGADVAGSDVKGVLVHKGADLLDIKHLFAPPKFVTVEQALVLLRARLAKRKPTEYVVVLEVPTDDQGMPTLLKEVQVQTLRDAAAKKTPGLAPLTAALTEPTTGYTTGEIVNIAAVTSVGVLALGAIVYFATRPSTSSS